MKTLLAKDRVDLGTSPAAAVQAQPLCMASAASLRWTPMSRPLFTFFKVRSYG